MNIKITCPIPEKGYQAGMTYDIPNAEAQEIIKRDMGFEVPESDPFMYIEHKEVRKTRKMKKESDE